MTVSKGLPEKESSDPLAKLGARLAEQTYVRRGVATSSEPIRVALVDDHTMVREGLRLLLRSTPDLVVMGEAANGADALALVQRLAPDILVLDLDMPGGDGATVLRDLAQSLPGVRVLILTVHAEQEHLLELLEAGARGYLTKEAASRELVDAIRVVAAGEIYVRPTVARLLAAAVVAQPAGEAARSSFQTLSQREQTILRTMAQGFSLSEIARQLGISRKTVDAYKHRIQAKLGLEHRSEFVRFAIEAGVLKA
ncbi:MAG: response regulator transcription factor [Gemmatimonadetes bacterium]|nr:response regulator transcription factor [Gemmatimonadota bacterium]